MDIKKNTTGFEKIKQLRNNLNDIFFEIDAKINALTHIYTDMVKTHVDKNYTLGLDSFYFQNKVIKMEYDNMQSIFNFIDNRVYCEYYKLLKMLYDFINKEIKDKSAVEKMLITHKHYPIYKDLEPSKIYDFNITTEINNTINNIIDELKHYTETKKEELSDKKKQSDMGINIDSMIHEQQYTIILLEERIHMFENYLNTFGNHHSKYFSRLTIKLKIMLGVVNEDFHLKNSKSLQLKRVNINKETRENTTITPIQNNEMVDSDTSSNGSNMSSIPTPSASMDEEEEHNVRFLVGDMNENQDVELELNTILQNIPQNEGSEGNNTRRTVKRNSNNIMEI